MLKSAPVYFCLVFAFAVPGAAQAKGELSRCQAYGKERAYPCCVPGDVIRSALDHRDFLRKRRPFDQRDDGGTRRNTQLPKGVWHAPFHYSHDR